jgi:hypothetical protein
MATLHGVRGGTNGQANWPLTISIFSLKGDTVTFTVNSLVLSTPIDTGGQFAEPVDHFNGGQPECSSCPTPMVNNGNSEIYVGGMFPQTIGQWLPVTSQAWFSNSPALIPDTSIPPFLASSPNVGRIALGSFAQVNLGCNFQSPSSMVISVVFAIRTLSGTGQLSVWVNGAPGTHRALTPSPVSTAWTFYNFPIAGNADVGAVFNNLQIQNGNTAITYFFDAFEINFAPNTLVCNPWYTSASTTHSSGTTAIATTTQPTPTTTQTSTTVLPTSTALRTTTAALTTTTRSSTMICCFVVCPNYQCCDLDDSRNYEHCKVCYFVVLWVGC